MTDYETFQRIDIRVGKIKAIEDFPEARKPAYKLTIDFGDEVGIKRSSAQLTKHYTKEDLLGTLILGVVNFPPRQIGPFMSEALTLGTPDAEGECLLVRPDSDAVIGGRLY
jgi:tRNA-binding protein